MNERPIGKGDLVRVVRWPCCAGALGKIDQVTGLRPPYQDEAFCGVCGATIVEDYGGLVVTERGYVWPLAWLKRIPPLSELEAERRDEEITA